MRHIHLFLLLITGVLFRPSHADAQRVPGAVTVRPSGGAPALSARPSVPAVPDDRSPARQNPARTARGTSSVTLVLVPSLPPGAEDARAVILRRARTNPQNVILVTSATTAADLTQAVAALFNSRHKQGDDIGSDMMARVAPAGARESSRRLAPASDSGAVTSAPRRSERRNPDEAARQLAMLRTAPATHVEDVGTYPARVVRLGRLRQ